MPNPKAKLRDQVHEVMRFHHYSARTEEAYWGWIVRFLKFHRDSQMPATTAQKNKSDAGECVPTGGWRHPREMGAVEVHRFLTHLATVGKVSASTQNQALNGLVFLYGEVLHQPLGEIGEYARAQRPARLPEVLSRTETELVLGKMGDGRWELGKGLPGCAGDSRSQFATAPFPAVAPWQRAPQHSAKKTCQSRSMLRHAAPPDSKAAPKAARHQPYLLPKVDFGFRVEFVNLRTAEWDLWPE